MSLLWYDYLFAMLCWDTLSFLLLCFDYDLVWYDIPCLSLPSSRGTRTMFRMTPYAWHSRRGVIDLRRSPLCVCIICDHYWPFMRVCDQSSTGIHTFDGSVWMHPRIYVYVWIWWPGGVCLTPLSHLWYLEVSPLRTLIWYDTIWYDMIWYDLTDFCMEFLWHILIWHFLYFHFVLIFSSYSVLMHSYLLICFDS